MRSWMRLFVAVELPRPVLEEVGDLVQSLRAPASTGDAEQLRWARPEQWHVTLAFLGEVAPARLPELRDRLTRAAHRHDQLEIQLSRGGRFDGSVLWVGVTGDREGLRALARSVQAAARRVGIPMEDRGFRPHLTLARARHRMDLRPWVARLDSWAGSSWTVHDIVLVHSRLEPPAAHTVIERFPLHS